MERARRGAPRPRAHLVVLATGLAGAFGYAIQAVAGLGLTATQYASFSVFWAATFLAVGALSGVQQETARAVHASERPAPFPRELAVAAGAIGALAAAVVLGSSPAWAHRVFVGNTFWLLALLACTCFFSCAVAVMSGVLYGTASWRPLAALIILDPALRFALIGVCLLAGAAELLPLAIVAPIPLSLAAGALLLRATRLKGVLVDVGRRELLANAGRAVVGAASTAILVSALPLFISSAAGGESAEVGALIFNLTLTRAPLVVPALAFQSLLVVYFRDRAAHLGRPLVTVLAVVLGAAVVLAAACAWFGGPFIGAVFGADYEIPGGVLGLLVGSAGFTAMLAITGAATIAARAHTWFLVGWGAAAVVSIGALYAVPGDVAQRTVIALIGGPLVGLAVHGAALAAARRRYGSAHDVPEK